MITKPVFIKLKILCGEFEFESISLHRIDETLHIDKYADNYAKQFYGEHPKLDNGWYGFFGNSVAVKVEKCHGLKEIEYNVLFDYL